VTGNGSFVPLSIKMRGIELEVDGSGEFLAKLSSRKFRHLHLMSDSFDVQKLGMHSKKIHEGRQLLGYRITTPITFFFYLSHTRKRHKNEQTDLCISSKNQDKTCTPKIPRK